MPDSPALAARDALRVFRMLALAAAACTLAVIVASAVVRHAQGYVWCIEWPACEARLTAGDGREPASAGVTVARIAHRLAATIAALLVVAMLVMARQRDPQWRPVRRAAVAALVLVIALAAFGAATAESRSPLVPLGNLARRLRPVRRPGSSPRHRHAQRPLVAVNADPGDGRVAARVRGGCAGCLDR